MLGPFAIVRDGKALPLPASRKVRALIAYLALAPKPVLRSQLCELLWEVPNDPRGELRWCLSKVRGLLDEPGRKRVDTQGDAVAIDLADCAVDVVEVGRATQEGIDACGAERLRYLGGLFAGDFLEGLEIDRSPAYGAWLTAQRRRLRACHTAVLERLVAGAAGDEVFGHLDKWLALAPFDQRVHALMLEALAARGRIREGEEHLAATERRFEDEGLDTAHLRTLWRQARARGGAGATRVETVGPATQATPAAGNGPGTPGAARRASIAIMPFIDRSPAAATRGGSADGLVHDVITRLAKLRSLFVIAQGTVFALHERGIGAHEAGRMLNVDYVANGTLTRTDSRITVTVELVETRTARVAWTDVFDESLAAAFSVLEEIGNRIVTSIAAEIETIERNRAILKPPNSLDAWEAYHRGLWHMYRFERADNEQAQHFFEAAVKLDPTFARAYAGLSFTHWQNVFQGWADREAEIERAYAAAGRSMMTDERDPAAHWAMGRALWLRRQHDHAIVALERAIDLSPNFALGHYTLGFMHAQQGDPRAAIDYTDQSRHLSPFDPLLFGMLGARAMAMARLGQYDEAAEWAIKAAARPNAHAHIFAIAAYCLALAGRQEDARGYFASIRRALPNYRVDDFLTAMQFAPDHAALIRAAAKHNGLA
ncbi:MAG: BTAD domain-containing putative transcriptional regulator [Pseudolabrys sp.]